MRRLLPLGRTPLPGILETTSGQYRASGALGRKRAIPRDWEDPSLRQLNRAELSAPEEADAAQIPVVQGSPGTTTPLRGSAHGQGDGPSDQKRLPPRGPHRGLSSNHVHLAAGQTGY